MIQDRGMKKWTAMMLPEHIEKLKECVEEENIETPSPLTDWELSHIQEQIAFAYKENVTISLTVYQDNKRLVFTGSIEQIKLQQAILSLKREKDIRDIPFASIRGADIDDFHK